MHDEISKHQLVLKEKIKSREFFLSNNYPNPFNAETKIGYVLPEDGIVSLKIYSTLGQIVSILVDEFQTAGYKNITFDAGDLPSGVYFYKLQMGKSCQVNKMFLIR